MTTSENLDAMFTRIIAECDGISEKEVTLEYIEKRRKEIFLHVKFSPRYPGLVSYSRHQLERIGEIIDGVLVDIHDDKDI